MKRVMIVVLIGLLLSAGTALAVPEDPINLEELEREWSQLINQYGRYLPEFNWRNPASVFDLRGLTRGLLLFLTHEIWVNARLLGQLLVLAVLSGLIRQLQSSFGSAGVSQVSRAVLYLVVLAVCIYSFTLAIDLARSTVSAMTDFIYSLVPILLAMLAGMGSIAGAAAFKPLLFTSAAVVGSLVNYVVLPLLYVGAVVAMVNKLMAGVGLDKLASFMRDIAVWGLSLLLTIFVGVTVINGSVATVADGVAFRTGKYAAKAAIPVVGGMFADAFETVAGASLVLKNSVGVFGLVSLAVICGFPILKLMALTFIYKLAAAILQPLGEESFSSTLETMAGYLTALTGAVVGVSLMFFLTVTVLVVSGNFMLMLR